MCIHFGYALHAHAVVTVRFFALDLCREECLSRFTFGFIQESPEAPSSLHPSLLLCLHGGRFQAPLAWMMNAKLDHSKDAHLMLRRIADATGWLKLLKPLHQICVFLCCGVGGITPFRLQKSTFQPSPAPFLCDAWN